MKRSWYLFALMLCFATACKKESLQKETVVNSSNVSGSAGADAVINALGPGYILGDYNSRGSRTIYNGQANDAGDNIKLILDFFATKRLTVAPDKQHLLLPYGYGNYIDKGWTYIIGYNAATKKITVEPNDAMKAGIEPGSFEVLYVDYSPQYKSWTFQTRFTALEDNGNESEMIEPMAKAE